MKILNQICPTEILFLEADSNYTVIQLMNGDSFISSYHLGILQHELRLSKNFIRPNRKFCVNLDFLTASTSDVLTINNKHIKISRRRKEEVKMAIHKFSQF